MSVGKLVRSFNFHSSQGQSHSILNVANGRGGGGGGCGEEKEERRRRMWRGGEEECGMEGSG